MESHPCLGLGESMLIPYMHNRRPHGGERRGPGDQVDDTRPLSAAVCAQLPVWLLEAEIRIVGLGTWTRPCSAFPAVPGRSAAFPFPPINGLHADSRLLRFPAAPGLSCGTC
jgi:hypothetical protein